MKGFFRRDLCDCIYVPHGLSVVGSAVTAHVCVCVL